MIRGINLRKTILSLLLASFLVYSVDFLPRRHNDIYHKTNYLEARRPKKLLLDLKSCPIPLELESPEVPEADEYECDVGRPSITYVRGDVISVNSSFKDAKCCYKGILRKPGTDNEITFAPECISVDPTVRVTLYDAVVVICRYGGSLYDDYHAVVRKKSSSVSEQNGIGPNILIIGLDSVSRFHFHTLLPKTRRVLEEHGSVEMLGYTKVGENTFPNAIAFLTGYEEDQVLKFCYSRARPLDSCPFLWRNLNMTTALLEDAPKLAIFNYFKFGFLHPPTDHYLRPLMLTAMHDFYGMKDLFNCVGSRSTEAFILDHIQQLHSVENPLFLFTWLTSLAHESVGNLPKADELFAHFFKTLNFSNTIVIFMSDHGHRYGETRTTFNGWYNEKLPFFTIALPKEVKSLLGPERMAALKSNARKLTTPFDAYRTIVEILQLYGLKSLNGDEGILNGQPFPRTRGSSLFTEISGERTCDEAGIPRDFCACGDLKAMELRHPLLERAARHALSRINKRLPARCIPLDLDQITGGAALNDREFIVGFTTKPGGFRLETVGWLNGTLTVHHVPRVNKIRSVWCVNDWFLEFYCHCSFLGFIKEFVFG